MNQHLKLNRTIFSIAGIFVSLCFVMCSSGTKQNIVPEKNGSPDTTLVADSSGAGMEEDIIRKNSWNQDTTIVLENGIYKLELRILVLNDTLAEDWIEYGFLAPFIKSQHLVFYKNGEIIKKYEIPIEKVIKTTKGQKRVPLLSFPIYEICLLKGNDIEVYEAYGSNYCNGILCPEFIGLYSMEGIMISEDIAAKKYSLGNLTDFLKIHKIDISDPVKCNSILKDFTIEGLD